ncbi:hypothetical protein L1887_34175 [Cichorium endivia]|nr:hypothetical protein L1887_34175 [Cichorium endivia]
MLNLEQHLSYLGFPANPFDSLSMAGLLNAITGIALPSGSNKLFCGSKDKSLRVWDCNSGECGVWSVECGVWSVECGVWSVECGVVVDFDGECGTLVNEGPWIFVVSGPHSCRTVFDHLMNSIPIRVVGVYMWMFWDM